QGSGDHERIDEGKRTFVLVSLAAFIVLLLAAVLFWYLVLPRFEHFGRFWVLLLSAVLAAGVVFLTSWYLLLLVTVFSRKSYTNICLTRGSSLFFLLYPVVIRLGRIMGISRDRLSHSFIRVSNSLVKPEPGEGPVLALLPRCLERSVRAETVRICGLYPGVIVHTAPGGTEARRIIRSTSPRAIVAVACERDLMGGIQDIIPRIPVIGIPNLRPAGPCKDTSIDIDAFRAAVEFFASE
ncbi:MAG TPA: DUF116 domain-containing protein, partial [Candidatus Krumholzibacterium sp.]|nr:DUF116 domain-containing protein [Candidatus Krumholzibacterium sp.]